MGVKPYDKGEHESGFVGFRVTAVLKGEYQQEYFSTSAAAEQSDACPVYKRQRLRAELKDAEWAAESALDQYQAMVTTNHPTTKPERGVGVQGITLGFFRDKRKKWTPEIKVSRPGKLPLRLTFATKLFSRVWAQAVQVWVEANEILPEDAERVLNSPPEPAQFSRLRKQMNEEGFDIPVEALHHVFREQRQSLAAARLMAKNGPAPQLKTSEADIGQIKGEMAEWFKRETAKDSA